MELDGLGSIYISGYFRETVDFDPNSTFHLNLAILPNLVVVISSGPTLTAQAQNSTFQWIECITQQAIPGAIDSVFQPLHAGPYAVIVTTNGCTDTSVCQIVNLVALEDVSSAEFDLFPNPTSGTLNLDLHNQYPSVKLKFSNALGQLLEEREFRGAREINFTIEGEAGLYFIESTREGMTPIVKKVIK